MSEYIERGALMDKIGERLAYLREKNGNYDPYTDGYEECYCEVEEAPAADVAPVAHGHFVHDGPRVAGGVDWWHCSNCGRLVSGVETRFDYCPWCGAKMDGGNDK